MSGIGTDPEETGGPVRAVAPRPLRCTKCGEPVDVAQDVTGHLDWGQAVVDADGTVHPAVVHMEFYKGDPVRVRAVCPSCDHQWTLRRPFDPTRGEHPRQTHGFRMRRSL